MKVTHHAEISNLLQPNVPNGILKSKFTWEMKPKVLLIMFLSVQIITFQIFEKAVCSC